MIAHLRSAARVHRPLDPARGVVLGERVAAADQVRGDPLVVEPAVNRRGVLGPEVAQLDLAAIARASLAREMLPVEAVAGEPAARRCAAEDPRGRAPSERWSTYQTSSSIRSSQGIPARPLTCAQPVSPGLTSSRRRWWGVYGVDLGGQGRARADDRHLAAQHVDQVRAARRARSGAAAAPTRVTRGSPASTGVADADRVGARVHRAQLVEVELDAVLPARALPVDRPGRASRA